MIEDNLVFPLLLLLVLAFGVGIGAAIESMRIGSLPVLIDKGKSITLDNYPWKIQNDTLTFVTDGEFKSIKLTNKAVIKAK